MAHIDVIRRHHLGLSGARRAAEQVAHELQHHHGLPLKAWWKDDTLHVAGRGFDARLEARPDTVRVLARLGLLLRPMRRQIEREVETYLDRYTDGRA